MKKNAANYSPKKPKQNGQHQHFRVNSEDIQKYMGEMGWE